MVFSQVKKNKENPSSVIYVLKTTVLLIAQLFRVVLLMQNPAYKKPPSVVFLSEQRSRDKRMQMKGGRWYK